MKRAKIFNNSIYVDESEDDDILADAKEEYETYVLGKEKAQITTLEESNKFDQTTSELLSNLNQKEFETLSQKLKELPLETYNKAHTHVEPFTVNVKSDIDYLNAEFKDISDMSSLSFSDMFSKAQYYNNMVQFIFFISQKEKKVDNLSIEEIINMVEENTSTLCMFVQINNLNIGGQESYLFNLVFSIDEFETYYLSLNCISQTKLDLSAEDKRNLDNFLEGANQMPVVYKRKLNNKSWKNKISILQNIHIGKVANYHYLKCPCFG